MNTPPLVINCAKTPINRMISLSFLVAGNVLGVGLLALPIKLGISGYLPTLIDILIICAAMVISAIVIAIKLPTDKKIFDLPSLFHREMGFFGKWTAIACNLIILYGIIIAYLSCVSHVVSSLFPWQIPKYIIITVYFMIATSLVVFGKKVLSKSSLVVLPVIWICFMILVFLGLKDFKPHFLTYSNWSYIPIGLPVVISAFHFQNVIPTISSCVDNNIKEVKKIIFLGVGIGLIMNIMWTTTVLGALSHDQILSAFIQGKPATVPMSLLLNSNVFTAVGLVFAIFAATAAYMANGSGLFGFIRDLLYSYFEIENRALAIAIAFLPCLFFAIIYPNIFLSILDLVGGIGEAMLFSVFPGVMLVRMAKQEKYAKKKNIKIAMKLTGVALFVIGVGVMLFVILEKLGITHLSPA